jgi:hypothetical protein
MRLADEENAFCRFSEFSVNHPGQKWVPNFGIAFVANRIVKQAQALTKEPLNAEPLLSILFHDATFHQLQTLFVAGD